MSQFLATVEFDSLNPLGRQSNEISIRREHQHSGTLDNLTVEGDGVSTAPTIPNPPLNRGPAIVLITFMFLIYVITSCTTGLITIGLPAISSDIHLDHALAYWPVLVYTLTSASLLLLAGTVADAVGHRNINLLSVFLLGVFVLACGLVKTGPQLLAFRALGGAALAFFLPTSISLVSKNIASGSMRNIGFSLLGMGQVLGYGLGLVVGGVFVSTVGWRLGYYLCSGILLVLAALGCFALQPDKKSQRNEPAWQQLKKNIDWIGLVLASGCLAIMAYVLAKISISTSSIREASNIALLVVGLLLIPGCAFWFQHQQRHHRPALIPNLLWKKMPFTTVCVMTMFAYAEMQTMMLLASLFFQQVQDLKPVQASIRILPSLITGAALELVTGALVHRIPALWLVMSTSIISAVSPLLMALIQPEWPYWWAAFPSQVLFPLCSDVLFTVALLIISEVFPEKDQALAGAVFNVVGQFGQSLGLAIIGVISNTVTENDSEDASMPAVALMKGYRAGFWTGFAWMILLCVIGAFGLRNVGKVGLKRE